MNATAATTRLSADAVVVCDEQGTVYQPGVVDITGTTIEWVGPTADAPVTGPETIRRHLDGLLMPGLVNTHAHSPMTLMRGAGDGLPLMAWLTEVMWPRESRMTADDAWWGMTLGCAEMLLAGVTTTCEMYLLEEAVIDAVSAGGARLVMTAGVVPSLHGGTDGSLSNRIDTIARVHASHHDPNGRITVGVAPHSPYDVGIEHCAELAVLARDLGALLHIHLAETRDEADELEAAHGGTRTTTLLAEAGVLDGRVLAAHGVWLDDADLDILARYDVSVAHCPVSNMKLGSGVAPVGRMRARGIRVGLGTDGPASNDTLDLWEEVKLAPLLARVAAHDPLALSAQDSLLMATREGALALGLPHVGHLTAGAQADLVHLDLTHPAFTPVTSPAELMAHVVWAGASRSVSTVWVAGEPVVADGQCTTIDVAKARREVQARGTRLARDSGT